MNLFNYYDELSIDELIIIQKTMLEDIKTLKNIINNSKIDYIERKKYEEELDFECLRLKYINKIIRQRQDNNEFSIKM